MAAGLFRKASDLLAIQVGIVPFFMEDLNQLHAIATACADWYVEHDGTPPSLKPSPSFLASSKEPTPIIPVSTRSPRPSPDSQVAASLILLALRIEKTALVNTDICPSPSPTITNSAMVERYRSFNDSALVPTFHLLSASIDSIFEGWKQTQVLENKKVRSEGANDSSKFVKINVETEADVLDVVFKGYLNAAMAYESLLDSASRAAGTTAGREPTPSTESSVTAQDTDTLFAIRRGITDVYEKAENEIKMKKQKMKSKGGK